MASTNPPQQQRRKVEINTTTLLKNLTNVTSPSPVYYIKVNGEYVPEEKPDNIVPQEKPDNIVPPSYDDDSDEDVDPLLEKEYYRQLGKSECFDLNVIIPNGQYYPYDWTNEFFHERVGIYGRIALHWYNFEKGSNLQLVRVVKYVEGAIFLGFTYYITMEVMDPANNSHLTFQTCVEEDFPHKKGDFKIVTRVCRIKPKPESTKVYSKGWNDQLIMNGFNDGNLEWLPDDALTQSGEKRNQYYELQESEIEENKECLNLYIELAFNSKLVKKVLPLKIKKVVVQTHEDVEPSKKAKSANAIFYIIYTDCAKDYATIVKRTTDGIQGHLALDFKLHGIRGFE